MSPLLYFPLFLSLLLPSSNGAQPNPNYPNCPSHNCNGVLISYPFWRNDTTTSPQYCGYQGFGVDCSTGSSPPIIHLPGDAYHVKNISYEDYSITLVDIDAAGQTCPRVRHGIEIQTLPLNYSSGLDLNLSFLFNCTRIPSFATHIPCLEPRANLSYVYVEGTEPEDFAWKDYCAEQVVTTVMKMAINPGNTLDAQFGTALTGGFVLNWRTTEDCVKCERSNGRCGRNNVTEEFMCFCADGTSTTGDCGSKANLKRKLILVAIAVIGTVAICCIACYFKNNSLRKAVALFHWRTENERNVEAFITEYGFSTPKRYTYSDIKRMTNSFRDKVGQGGYGSVFKGRLLDSRLVAVKVLNSSKGNGEEFINEVASIGRTSHVNIVTLLGFCYNGRKKALIYEFMPNGSLENFIYGNNHLKKGQYLGVNKLYEVALGIAQGLEYLHRGCNTRILHLDIKPQNILLDEDFAPKIADFGLAKLYSRKESIISMLEARGTIGYIAPEVFSRNFGAVSHKSDVYSYGMMVLEMVGGRKNVEVGSLVHTSEIYFPHWIYKRLELEENLQLEGVITVEENEIARKMTLVGLWCIQTNPSQRPSINEVIEMLEGSMESLKVPPKPFLSSPPRSPSPSTTTVSTTLQ